MAIKNKPFKMLYEKWVIQNKAGTGVRFYSIVDCPHNLSSYFENIHTCFMRINH
jgi:hypothetical protein